jgi:hypothetical protein
MTSLAARLARPEIMALAPFDIAAQANEAFGPDAIKLDANENPYPPLSEGALAAGLNRYPEPQPPRLKRAMAALYGLRRTSSPSPAAPTMRSTSSFVLSAARGKMPSRSAFRPSRLMRISRGCRARGSLRLRSTPISTSMPIPSLRRFGVRPR